MPYRQIYNLLYHRKLLFIEVQLGCLLLSVIHPAKLWSLNPFNSFRSYQKYACPFQKLNKNLHTVHMSSTVQRSCHIKRTALLVSFVFCPHLPEGSCAAHRDSIPTSYLESEHLQELPCLLFPHNHWTNKRKQSVTLFNSLFFPPQKHTSNAQCLSYIFIYWQ